MSPTVQVSSVPSPDRLFHGRREAAQAGALARLLDPKGPGSWTHPDLSPMVHADGKALTLLFKAHPGDTKLDKVRLHGTDEDAKRH